jgi:N-carbamoyl-L-amino-acid hydrolase
MIHALQELNSAPEAAFVGALRGIFEHSPWIAQRAAAARPFRSRLELLEAMRTVIAKATPEEQLGLIRAHPELAGKAAIRNELTPESGREQRTAGLHACKPHEFSRLHELNAAYRERFAFPFILAVRGHTPASIIRTLEQRLQNDIQLEHASALREIGCIGGYRLADLVASPPGDEIMAMIDHLARFSERDDNLTCSYLSAAHRATASQIKEWMLAAGLDVEIDAVGNVVGRLPSGRPGARTLIAGSHYDTVVNAGRYDGRLGIVLPVVCIQQLRQNGTQLPFDLEIVAFSDEEGVRFNSTFVGSSALAGGFDAAALDIVDANGVTMRSAMLDAELDPAAIPMIARDPRQLLGYIEVHIEQGPILLNEQRPLGVVTAIAGSVRYRISITGQAGHAGTVPMSLRRDAAAAAAEIVLLIEKRCSGTPGLVGTVGRLEVPDGAVNVIPGRCELTIDLRAPDDALLDSVVADVLGGVERIAARRHVDVRLEKLMRANCAPCSPRMQKYWAESVSRVTGEASPRYLPSGAGHDAMKMASMTEIGMLFVRCGHGGISHHPAESIEPADADVAVRVFQDFIVNFRVDA